MTHDELEAIAADKTDGLPSTSSALLRVHRFHRAPPNDHLQLLQMAKYSARILHLTF